MALSKGAKRRQLNGLVTVPMVYDHPVKAGAIIHPGSLVVLQGGYARAGLTAVGLIACGVAQAFADNTGALDGAKTVRVHAGAWVFKSGAGADLITQVNVGAEVFIVDDETVALTNGTGTRSRAGRVVQVDAEGVWVLLSIGL